jgi:hypothetical protein
MWCVVVSVGKVVERQLRSLGRRCGLAVWHGTTYPDTFNVNSQDM